MGVVLTPKDVEKQSKEVFNQFGQRWQKFAKINVQLPHEQSDALSNCGIGKFLVCAAMGESLEENLDVLLHNRYKYDIITCDKGFGALLERGIKADYVMICDTNIPFRWLEKYVDDTKDVKLLATPYANVEWTMAWKGPKYFYVSKDAIQTEQIFGDIFSLNPRIIPASSNVSNSMLVYFLTIGENNRPVNWGGYEKYYLVGYDYSWRPEGKYYAFGDPKPKRYYMNHRTFLDINQDYVFTSENLLFSAKWMYSYLTIMKSPVVNCSRRGLLDYTRKATLEDEFKKINDDRKLRAAVIQAYKKAEESQKRADNDVNTFMALRNQLTKKEEAS